MTDVSKVTPRGHTNLNCAVLFSCDEQAYQDFVALAASVHGVHIYYTKSSTLRLILEERGLQG
jgi:hypothetical protein